MAALPSFVELMASLGLSKDGDAQGTGRDRHGSPRSRSSSESQSSSALSSPMASPPLLHIPAPPSAYQRQKSPSIVVSEFDAASPRANEPEFIRRASSGNIKTSRYTPYQSSVCPKYALISKFHANIALQSRRGSMSTLSDGSREQELTKVRIPIPCSRRDATRSNHTTSTGHSSLGFTTKGVGSKYQVKCLACGSPSWVRT